MRVPRRKDGWYREGKEMREHGRKDGWYREGMERRGYRGGKMVGIEKEWKDEGTEEERWLV